MKYIFVITLFLLILIMSYVGLTAVFAKKRNINSRLGDMTKDDEIEVKVKKIEQENIGSILNSHMIKMLIKIIPNYTEQKHKSLVYSSGVLKKMNYNQWIGRKMLITTVLSLIISILVVFSLKSAISFIFSYMISIVLISFFYRFALLKKISDRKKILLKELPYTLDLITASVESGLSLDGAFLRIVNTIEGELPNELAITLKDIKMGIDKRKALKNLGIRCDVKEIIALMNAVVQADELGVSLGKILRIQAQQLREKMQQVAKVKAMKAPVKMLLPLMLFIFPVIFIIILGPIAIQMMDIFK